MISLLLFICSAVSDSATPQPAARQASLSFTISRSLLKVTPTESGMPSNRLILSYPPPVLDQFSQDLTCPSSFLFLVYTMDDPEPWGNGFNTNVLIPDGENNGGNHSITFMFRLHWCTYKSRLPISCLLCYLGSLTSWDSQLWRWSRNQPFFLKGFRRWAGPLRTWVTEWIRWTPPRVQDYLSQQMEIISKLGALCF